MLKTRSNILLETIKKFGYKSSLELCNKRVMDKKKKKLIFHMNIIFKQIWCRERF